MSSSGATLVTGGGSGIGGACARGLVAAGASVLVADIDLDAAESVAAEIGPWALAFRADSSDPADVAAMVAAAADAFGPLRGAVNNAGITSPMGTIRRMPIEAWRRVMRVNLDGVFLCLQAELVAMREAGGGAVVNMASVLGQAGAPHVAPYVAAKHGVLGLTKAAALECGAEGIRVNAVAPGFIETPFMTQNTLPDVRQALLTQIPAGRLGTPDEVARLVVWLLSEEAAYVNGACFTVDGGYLAG